MGINMETIINLPVYGIRVVLTKNKVADTNGNYYKSGKIDSLLLVDDGKEFRTTSNNGFDAAIHGIEALILAHACAGIYIESPEYIEGITTAVTAISNYFGD
jgi:hypothetical protein